MIYSIGLSISVIFLLATLATGFILPSNHHVLHWRCQTFYVGCLLVGDLLLAINQIFGAEISGFPCFSIGEFANLAILLLFLYLYLSATHLNFCDCGLPLAPLPFPIVNAEREEIEEMTSFF